MLSEEEENNQAEEMMGLLGLLGLLPVPSLTAANTGLGSRVSAQPARQPASATCLLALRLLTTKTQGTEPRRDQKQREHTQQALASAPH